MKGKNVTVSSTIPLLCIFGIMLSIGAHVCVPTHLNNSADAKLFGQVPWSVIGIAGYVVIGCSLLLSSPVITTLLVTSAGLVTIWLVYQAVKLRLGCPVCPAIFLINFAMVVIVYGLPYATIWHNQASRTCMQVREAFIYTTWLCGLKRCTLWKGWSSVPKWEGP